MLILRKGSLILLILLLAYTSAAGVAKKRGRLLSRDEVATTWIGLTEDELYLIRISLLPTGAAEVAYSFLDDEPRLFRGMSWNYDPKMGSAIRIGTTGPDRGISFKGDVVGVKMQLVISERDWNRKVSLRREAELESRWKRLRDAMGHWASEP